MIETLELIVAQNQRQKFEREIEQVVNDVIQNSLADFMKVYRKFNLESDYLVVISSIATPVNKNGTELGYRIKNALSAYGIVNYSIWDEIL